MRPVDRGDSPQTEDFVPYEMARQPLMERIGPFCSFCERTAKWDLAVEHIEPKKGDYARPELEGRWTNFLLGCRNCNSTKGTKQIQFDQLFLPDRDNTFAAFEYRPDGTLRPDPNLTEAQMRIALATLRLTGLDVPEPTLPAGNALREPWDRVGQRRQVWRIAEISREQLRDNPTDGQRRHTVLTAIGHGFFSVWMAVFHDDPEMRKLLIRGFHDGAFYFGFRGTADDCFDRDAEPVTPRPTNALEHSGKV